MMQTLKYLHHQFLDEIDRIFKQKPKDIIKDTEFASKFCEKKFLN